MHKWHIMDIKFWRAAFQDVRNTLDIPHILCLALIYFLPHIEVPLKEYKDTIQ